VKNGLIVSIQGFSLNTAQEIADQVILSGAVGIRTDQPVNVSVPVIGLEKIEGKKYYISTHRDCLIRLQKWSDYIALDCRSGNSDLLLFLSHLHVNSCNYVADVRNIADVENLLKLCEESKAIKPAYIATTFNYNGSQLEKASLIAEIKKITDIPIIAEGGYKLMEDVGLSMAYGASCVCIGHEITGIASKTLEFVRGINAFNRDA
jgi:putative N-acetylmannosamine-6-phosphate epimerase